MSNTYNTRGTEPIVLDFTNKSVKPLKMHMVYIHLLVGDFKKQHTGDGADCLTLCLQQINSNYSN